VAEERLAQINPHVRVEPWPVRLHAPNALDILRAYDVVADGSDNFSTRYLVNDACDLLGKPLVYGSIFRFEGQASVFFPPAGPCYRCLFPEPPPPESVPTCAEAGVLGVVPGLSGLVQATEVMKLLVGRGAPLIGRLLLYDALKMEFRELQLARNADCPSCGANRSIHALTDLGQFCGGHVQPPDSVGLEISPAQLSERLGRGERICLLDVRESYESDICALPGSLPVPMGEAAQRLGELDPSTPTVVYCHAGARGDQVAHFLREHGFSRV
jgi:sulfur-carrier protein adenylyltransferase/sulfurtransferase